MSREYAIAVQFVQRKYRALYEMAEAVVLTPADLFPAGQTGQCSSDCYVSVSDGIRTVAEFVNTLVHELTHVKQFRERRQPREPEAYEAGIQAQTEYMREAAPWMLKNGGRL